MIENKLIETNDIKSNKLNSNNIKSNKLSSNNIKSNKLISNNIKSNELDSNKIKSKNLVSNNIKSNNCKFNNVEVSNGNIIFKGNEYVDYSSYNNPSDINTPSNIPENINDNLSTPLSSYSPISRYKKFNTKIYNSNLETNDISAEKIVANDSIIQDVENTLFYENKLDSKSELFKITNLNGYKTRLQNNLSDDNSLKIKDLEKYLPYAIKKDKDDNKGISYKTLIPSMIESIKELTNEIKRLKKWQEEALKFADQTKTSFTEINQKLAKTESSLSLVAAEAAAAAAAAAAAEAEAAAVTDIKNFNSVYEVYPNKDSGNEYLSISSNEFISSPDYGSFDEEGSKFSLKLYFTANNKFEISFESEDGKDLSYDLRQVKSSKINGIESLSDINETTDYESTNPNTMTLKDSENSVKINFYSTEKKILVDFVNKNNSRRLYVYENIEGMT